MTRSLCCYAAPKTNTEVEFNATETAAEGDGSASSSTDELGALTSAVGNQVSGLHKHIAPLLAKV
jgi:hypothetical protein